MTKQEMFDKVHHHFIGTNHPPSFWIGNREDFPDNPPSQCRYRDDKGNKCAVGIFIPDDEYDPNIEGMKVVDIVNCEWFGRDLNSEDIDFLEALQSAHDRSVFSAMEIVEKDVEHKHFHPAFINIMELRLKIIAKVYELYVPLTFN